MSDAACQAHDHLAVQVTEGPPRFIGRLDEFATLDRIRAAVGAGQLRLLRADSPLELTKELVLREAKFSFVHFLECQACGSFLLFGIHIRGAGVFRTVPFDDIDRWPWDHSPTQIDNMPEYRADHAR